MPLTTNPVISLSASREPNASRTSSPGQEASYGAGNEKEALDRKISALSGGPNSGLNGQVQPTSRLRATDELNKAVQNQVDIQSNALVDEITEAANAQNALSAQRIVETIASGGASPQAINNILNEGNADLRERARSINLPKVDLESLLTTEANNFDWGDPETIVRAIPTERGDWRVRIAAPSFFGNPEDAHIVFPVLPTMTLSHKATYKEESLVHTNYQFLSYRNSSPDDIQISCEWPVETEEDAVNWLKTILLGRALTKMFYGSSQNLGNPPPICTLKGYGSSNTSVILPDVPVVVKSFSFDLRDDVDYIELANNYVPRLSTVSVTCTIVYNRNSQRAFNYDDARRGIPNTPIRY
jgi:hypothetical protein